MTAGVWTGTGVEKAACTGVKAGPMANPEHLSQPVNNTWAEARSKIVSMLR